MIRSVAIDARFTKAPTKQNRRHPYRGAAPLARRTDEQTWGRIERDGAEAGERGEEATSRAAKGSASDASKCAMNAVMTFTSPSCS
jgi:hypothetical protein